MKRIVLGAALALVACGWLFGCGGGITEGTADPKTPAPVEEPAATPVGKAAPKKS